MNSVGPPNFLSIADEDVRRAFLSGNPSVTELLHTGTKLFKWTASIATSRGISPPWQFLKQRRLANEISVRESPSYRGTLIGWVVTIETMREH
jgi:hypothetical protein